MATGSINMKILIVKLSAIGDVIHALPALNALRNHYPEANITWLVEAAAAAVIADHPALDQVVISRRKEWGDAIFGKSCSERKQALKAAFGFIRELRQTRYDLIIDFQNLLKSGFMAGLARGDCKVGFDKGMQRNEKAHFFYNRRVSPVSMEIHAVERYLMLLEAIGIKAKEISYQIPVSDAHQNMIDQLLAKEGVDKNQPLVVINPMARWETKLWRPERFAQVADYLLGAAQVKVVFTGGAADRDKVDVILSIMKKKAVNLAGHTSLKELAALYRRAELFISTDTGPMHLAAAMGTPVVALFGPTAPWRTGPYGDGHRVIFSKDPCAPCFKRACDTNLCMAHITVDEVLKAVGSLLKIG